MATIDWAVVCGHAFFDQHNKPCIIGIIERLHVPHMPLVVKQLVVVAHLADIPGVDEISVTVVVNTPDGFVASPQRSDAFGVDAVDEYILATLYDVPLVAEGNDEFEITVEGYLARDGSHLANARTVTLSDGRTVFAGSPIEGDTDKERQ